MGTLENEQKGQFLTYGTKPFIGIVVVLIILMIVVPLPKMVIDILMALNLSLSIILLLVVVYTSRASNLSSFPQIILLFTLFGLGLNISSTRLILTASSNLSAQSAMVQAFANIVTGDNLVIGFVMFVIIIIIQVVVITKGAGRVSEVSARFTLDAMSTKQFDIDNRLSQGYITEEEAKNLKDQLSRDIDFYSNMDGSSKFVSGNVKAGIFITVINLVGGFLVGMLQNQLSWSEALNIYATLTIGDGLLSQVPSLLLSFATGLLVTADKSPENLGEKIAKEFFVDGVIFQITGGVVFALAIAFHNRTALFLIPLSLVIFFYGTKLSSDKKKSEVKRLEEEAKIKAESNKSRTNPESDSVAPLDPLQLQLGYALIPLVDKDKGAELLERITRMRRECALEIGLPVPKIRIIDNMSLEPNVYSFQIRGIEVASSTIRLGHYMCMDTGAVTETIQGEATKDPAFGMNAIWVPEERRSEAEQAGYAIVDPPTLISTHITETIRHHAADILGRQEVEILLNSVKETNPIVVNEVLNGDVRKFSYGDIEKILKGLLKELVSIRDMVTILETISNFGGITSNSYLLTEKVREALGKQICLQYADSDKKLRVVNLSQKWSEEILNHHVEPNDGSEPFVAFDEETSRHWINDVSNVLVSLRENNVVPIIMCASIIRPLVYSALVREVPGIIVISDKEILAGGRDIQLEVLGEISYSGSSGVDER